MANYETLADLFDATDVRAGGGSDKREFEELPEGKYQVEILEAVFKEGDTPWIQVKARVASGPHAGRYLFPSIFLRESASAISIAKESLEVLGLKGVKFKELKDRLTRVNGVRCEINKKHVKNPKDASKPYVNYYYNAPETSEEEPDAGFE